MRILITNDDGVESRGLLALKQALDPIGDTTVVALDHATLKIDGKAGMLTRAALGKYQKANGLKLDCWPTAAVLSHMQARR